MSAPGDAPQGVSVITLNTTAIHIQWDPPLIPNGVIISYNIYIDGVLLLNISATSGTQNISIAGFSPYQTVNVSLSANTKVGEGPLSVSQSVTTHESGIYNLCSSIYYREINVYIIYHIYHTVPSPVKNLQVTAQDATTINALWDPPTFTNGVLTGYTVLVANLINTTDTISYQISSTEHGAIITSGIGKLKS